MGKNLYVFEYDDWIVVIDCGLMFPEDDMFGIDLVVPDITYLTERRDRVLGIFITHGHEDHTGGIPYLVPMLDCPVYATRLTLGLIAAKLREHGQIDRVALREVRPGQAVRTGPFDVEPFHVAHSMPDCVGYILHTPLGAVVHTGDWKFDQSPVDGLLTDTARLAELGGEGVLALCCDCVRVEQPGFTPSERVVGEAFDRIFQRAEGRVILTTFASNISRVQQAVQTAYRHGRRAAIVGRSMENNVAVARELGYFSVPDDAVLRLDEVARLPDRQVLFLTTGSQGEPSSALTRIANNDHRQIKLQPGDTVVLSATPVPGNEEAVNRTISNLFRQGADVIYGAMETVHVSGHASREEIRLMLNLVRPKYLIPVHGDYRHLALCARVGLESGIALSNIIIPDIGSVIELGPDFAAKTDTVPSGSIFVDGLGVGDVGHVVLRDRRTLAQDGICIAVATIDRETGELLAGPDIVSRGFVGGRDSGELFEGARERVRRAIASVSQGPAEWTYLNQKIRDTLSKYLYEQTGRRPMVLPLVMEV